MVGEHAHQPPREADADRRAGGGEQEAFDQQLLHETASAGAKRQTHADLARPRGAARQQHAGDVRARDQQDKADGDHAAADDHREHPVSLGMDARRARGTHRHPAVLCSSPDTRAVSCAAATCMLARACSTVTPGFNRAFANSHRDPRRSCLVVPVGDGTLSMIPAGSTSSSRAVVTHNSGASIGVMPVNVRR